MFKVVFAYECYPCELCDEPVCPTCDVHYADCTCPGPDQDDLYEYLYVEDILYAREKPNDN